MVVERAPEAVAARMAAGAQVLLLRQAVARGERLAARDLFVALLERIAGSTARWAHHTAGSVSTITAEERRAIAEDLEQELALHLWEQLALRQGEVWEGYFFRALEFAQRHVATAYLRRNGYWRDPTAAHPTRGVAWALSRLERDTAEDNTGTQPPPATLSALAVEPPDTADLADLRVLVARLPPRERSAVILRFWQGADEWHIARALHVTPRTVRNLLRRAYILLRSQYEQGNGQP